MSNVKSIRKCNNLTTAEELGVKVGDKFIVLPQNESFGNKKCCTYGNVGDVLVFKRDDGTCCPYFFNQTRGHCQYEDFSCLARYEDYYKQQEKENEMKQNDDVVLENVKFNMLTIAADLGISLEEAHEIVQPMLFEDGVMWNDGDGDVVHFTYATFLVISTDKRLFWDYKNREGYKELSIKLQPTFYVKEQPKELVEFNGRKYNKEDLEKALALLSPVSE